MTRTYFACRWQHDLPDEPVELYGELDEQRWQLRKVEVFRDGRTVILGPNDIEQGATALDEAPVPPFSEIAADPQFEPREITAEEFEAIWRRHPK